MKQTNRILSVVLCLVMLLAAVPAANLGVTASAKSCYENLYDGDYNADTGLYVASIAQSNLGRKLGSYYNEHWCSDFACDCYRKAGVSTDIVPNDAVAPGLVEFFVKNDQAFFRQSDNTDGTFIKGEHMPKIGDVAGICNCGSRNSKGINYNSTGKRYCVDHVGIVVDISEADGTITTVEGNVSGSGRGSSFYLSSTVKKYTYYWNNSSNNGQSSWSEDTYIQYICHPKYTEAKATLIYDANGGSGAPRTKTVNVNERFDISNIMPNRSGYSFLGWSTKQNSRSAKWAPGSTVYISNSTTVTLYAVWLSGSVKTNYATPLKSGATYYISPACAPSKVFDVDGGGKTEETNIHLWEKQNSKNQQWKAVSCGSGYYYFIDSNSGLALDVNSGLALNEKNVSLWTLNKTKAQLFRLIPAGNGYYYIQSKANPAYYLDVYNGNNSNGTNVQLYQANFSDNQKFKFTKTDATVLPTKVSLNTTSCTMNKGDSRTLYATITPSDATNQSITWLTSNSSVASVDSNGRITAKAAGTATIRAKTSNGKKADCKVTVVSNNSVKISLLSRVSKSKLVVGDVVTLSAASSSGEVITWTSSNRSVVSIGSKSGRATAKASGSATITAKTSSGDSDSFTITVKAAEKWQTGTFDSGYIAQGYTTVRLNRGKTGYITIHSYDSSGNETEADIHVKMCDSDGNWLCEFDTKTGTKLRLGSDHNEYRVYVAKKQLSGQYANLFNAQKCVYWAIECKSGCYIK